MHYQLPFNEDIRSFEFPSLEEIGESPTDHQLDLVDAYIDALDLGPKGYANYLPYSNCMQSKPVFRFTPERVKCRDVKNPKFLHMAAILKHRHKNPKGPLPPISAEQFLGALQPPKALLDEEAR